MYLLYIYVLKLKKIIIWRAGGLGWVERAQNSETRSPNQTTTGWKFSTQTNPPAQTKPTQTCGLGWFLRVGGLARTAEHP